MIFLTNKQRIMYKYSEIEHFIQCKTEMIFLMNYFPVCFISVIYNKNINNILYLTEVNSCKWIKNTVFELLARHILLNI